ncbi:hypothetical protein HZC27_01765 [Candidatus Roizmanbacteria bacterium]|nr:hypothetical protein [Candidatus Roizmanbacteria bacterium]
MKTQKIALKKEMKSLRQSIFMKCLDCTCCQSKEILLCEIPGCPLWNLRPKKLEGLYVLIEKLKQKNPDLYVVKK